MEEKEIPHYINDPMVNRLTAPKNRLYRPKINFIKTIIVVIGTLCGTLILSVFLTVLLEKIGVLELERKNLVQVFCKIYFIMQLLVIIATLKYILIWFIRVYQRYAKAETRLRCCYIPSCSEYTILALKKYGVLLGGFKAAKRLLRCGPPGGIDYP